MAPNSAPAKLTTTEYHTKMASTAVDIYVGAEEKHYSVPKDILSHYSSYFDRCFNGAFLEASENKLTLPEDKVEHFEIILYYVLTGNAAPQEMHKGHDAAAMESCMDLIRYCHRYDLAEASMATYDNLTLVLYLSDGIYLKPDHIQLVYRAFPSHDHLLRELIAKHAVPFVKKARTFQKQEEEVDGFAADILKQMRKENQRLRGSAANPLAHDFFNNLTIMSRVGGTRPTASSDSDIRSAHIRNNVRELNSPATLRYT